MSDISIIYYTSNYLEEKNPFFLKNTKAQLVKAIDDKPLIVVSQKPVKRFEGYTGDFKNVNIGDIGKSHLNIYRQILEGCRHAQTEWVAMAEDDILYSREHFLIDTYIKHLTPDRFYYDMNKVSIFTWSKPPIFSFRSKRMVVNQLIAPRKLLIDALEERFKRFEVLRAEVNRKHPEIDAEQSIIKYWGDPGRYEDILGVTVRKTSQEYSWVPSVVFSHTYAFGFENNQGKKKKHGDLRMIELCDWGRAEDVLKLWGKAPRK